MSDDKRRLPAIPRGDRRDTSDRLTQPTGWIASWTREACLANYHWAKDNHPGAEPVIYARCVNDGYSYVQWAVCWGCDFNVVHEGHWQQELKYDRERIHRLTVEQVESMVLSAPATSDRHWMITSGSNG